MDQAFYIHICQEDNFITLTVRMFCIPLLLKLRGNTLRRTKKFWENEEKPQYEKKKCPICLFQVPSTFGQKTRNRSMGRMSYLLFRIIYVQNKRKDKRKSFYRQPAPQAFDQK